MSKGSIVVYNDWMVYSATNDKYNAYNYGARRMNLTSGGKIQTLVWSHFVCEAVVVQEE